METPQAVAMPRLRRARLAEFATRAPVRATLLLAAGELVVYSVYQRVFAQLSGHDASFHWNPESMSEWGFHWYPEAVLALLLAYALVAPFQSARGARSDLRALGPVLDGSQAEVEQLDERLGGAGRRAHLRFTALGALLGVAINFYPGIWAAGAPPGWSNPELSWGLIRNGATLALMTRFFAVDLEVSGALSRLGRDRVRIDLLDLRPLAPFARNGLRSALLYVVAAAILAPMALGPWALDWLVAALIAYFAVGLAMLLLPMRGVHLRIGEAKAAELAAVRAAIRRQRETLLEPGAAPPGRLAEQLAYEARIAGVSEWPFDTPTVLRFALVLAIPLGSWLGGALMERLIDALLR
jgi:hypothetical protein